jgi:hypothetical protein
MDRGLLSCSLGTPLGIAFETQGRLHQQFRSHCQVGLGTDQIRMPQMYCQCWKKFLDVRSLLIPSDKTMDSKRVTIMPTSA